jgi:hypothetical protein
VHCVLDEAVRPVREGRSLLASSIFSRKSGRRFGLFDCNANGIPDACDIASGFELDANADGRPDSCDNDCNANAINDAVEIAGGAADVDGDGRLDACERAAGDGNLDGIIGPEDLTMLLSAWGTNGVPFGDLDLNGTVAASDLAVILANWGSRP